MKRRCGWRLKTASPLSRSTSRIGSTRGTLPAARAHQLGLVSELAATGACLDAARKIAERIAKMPPLATAAIKQSLAAGADLPLSAALALETRDFLLLFDTEDQKEGMTAFLEKRPAVFNGA